MPDHYDVIIIGTGAGGGTLAHRLAPTGKRVLLLERGGYLPREPENWDTREVFRKERYLSGEEWIDRHGTAFRPHQQYFVGGNTKFYGSILFRLRPRDFGQVRHHAGISPAWPLSYEDLEPYYAEAERLYLVHGRRGEDPTEGAASGPFPHPPVSHEPRIQQLHDDLAAAGHRPFHLPVGVDLDERDPEAGRCVRCDRFDGFPCLTDGKADAHVRCVRPALTHPNVTLRTHARVVRLATDGRGREVTQVVVDRRGTEERYTADVVVVSCGAANSAALLLRSASETHPHGLANGSDQVGRNYMAHINSGVVALSQAPNTTKFQKTLGLNDFYERADDARLPARAHPDAGQERQGRAARRRAVVRARPGPGLRGQARDRLLADHRGPARPRQPRDRRPRRTDPPAQGRPQHRAAPAAAGQAQGPAEHDGVQRPPHPALVGPRRAHPAGRRRAPVRHGALRHGPVDVGRSTSTARRTSSTTSTSSTRASSRARAR